MATEIRRRLRCVSCSQPIELPKDTPAQWAKAAWPITIVCRHCFHQSGYSENDIRVEDVSTPSQSRQVDVLWRVTFQCAYHNCHAQPRDIYMSCEHFMIDEVPGLVLRSGTAILCDDGHPQRHLNVHSVCTITSI